MTKHDMRQFSLPPVRRDELHDDIALALDAISGPRPSARNLAEAASYLRHALRLIVGEADLQGEPIQPRKLDYLSGSHLPRGGLQ